MTAIGGVGQGTKREPKNDKGCAAPIKDGTSGYCEYSTRVATLRIELQAESCPSKLENA